MASLPNGVPPLAGAAAALFAVPSILHNDTVSSILGFGTPQWGLYDQNNEPVLTADNVVAVDFKKTYRISDYPIEDGDFSTYNKVPLPFDGKVVFSQGGSVSDRATFLGQAESVAASLDLLNLVMPEIVYPNCNTESYAFGRRADRGVTLVVAEFHVKEIRQTATQTFTQTAQPAGADQVNVGTVQPQPVTQQQQSAISDLFGG